MIKLKQKLSIQETAKFSDFLRYLFIIINEGLWGWTWYVFVVRIFGGKNSTLIIIKNKKKIIGGFFITNFPLAKYKLYNWFNIKIRMKIKELVKKEYQYFCCFVIKKANKRLL